MGANILAGAEMSSDAILFPELLAVGPGPPDLPPEHLPHATLVPDRTPGRSSPRMFCPLREIHGASMAYEMRFEQVVIEPVRVSRSEAPSDRRNHG